MKKKVLLFDLAGLDFPGGCEKYFANLGNYLSENHQVSAISSKQYRAFMDYVYFVVTRRKIGSIGRINRSTKKIIIHDIKFLSLIPMTKSRLIIKKILLKQDYIYAKNEFQELIYLYTMLGKKAYSEKVIIGVHTPIFIPTNKFSVWSLLHKIQYNSFLYKEFLLNAYSIHVNNSDYSRKISNSYGVDTKKIIFISNPINWDPKAGRSKGGSSKFTLFWLGRFTAQKGLDRLESIINKLSSKKIFKGIEIVIGGEGEELYRVQNICSKYKNVTYAGFILDPTYYYKVTDLSLFTAYFDTFAHAVLEPLSYGIPVISYDIDGPRDMLKNTYLGKLVNTDSQFVAEIQKMFSLKKSNPNRYSKMKKEIYKSVNERYDKKNIFNQLEKLFN